MILVTDMMLGVMNNTLREVGSGLEKEGGRRKEEIWFCSKGERAGGDMRESAQIRL